MDNKKRSFLNSSFEAMERKNAHENISCISIPHNVEKSKRILLCFPKLLYLMIGGITNETIHTRVKKKLNIKYWDGMFE